MMSSPFFHIISLVAFVFFNFSLSFGQSLSIQEQFEHDAFQHASVGFTLIDHATGDLIVDFNSDLALIPASTLKTITTFSALNILGAQHTITTPVYISGEIISDGTLLGDLILKGNGDPTLGSPFFEKALSSEAIFFKIFTALQEQGIVCIDGDIKVDQSLFSDESINETWQWNDIGNYYAAGAWPFNFHENMFFLSFKRSAAEGEKTEIMGTIPLIQNFRISNYVTTGPKGSGDNAYIYGHPLSTDIEVRGTIPPGITDFEIKGALPRPHVVFKNHLHHYLLSKGIHVNNTQEPIKKITKSEKKEVVEFQSPTISDIAKEANEKSNNLFCEVLLKKIGVFNDTHGSTRKGVSRIEDYLKELQIPSSSVTIKDGSGLSARNRISTKAIAQFINAQMHQHSFSFVSDHLSEVGEDGHVKNMLKHKSCDYAAFMKTGSMSQVVAYCGVIEKNGMFYSFSFISNGHIDNARIRKRFESIFDTLMTLI